MLGPDRPTSREETLQQQLDQFEREMKGLRNRLSRFERLLVKNNIIDSTNQTAREARDTSRMVVLTSKRDRHIAGKVIEEVRYSVHVLFSPDGEVFTEPLVNPTAGTVYQIRVEVTQHHPGPDFQGFRLFWRLPSGWAFADGHGDTTEHEAVSNPTVITRKATYSSGSAGWRVVTRRWYRP